MGKKKSSRGKSSTRDTRPHVPRKRSSLGNQKPAKPPNETGRLKQEPASSHNRLWALQEGREVSGEELQTGEGGFWALFETAAQGIIVVDAKGGIVQVNAAGERMFGYARDEMLGRPVEMLLPDSVRKVHRQHVTEYFSGPRARPMGIGMDLAGQRKDGKVFPVEVSLSYLKARNALMAVAFVSDITMRKTAEETSRRLAVIVESSDDAIFSETMKGVVTSWNRGAERIYGYAATEVIGRSVSLLIPKDRRHERSEILKQIRGGKQLQHYETERVRKDGKRIAVSLTISPVRSPKGKIVSASAIARDITKKKQALEILSHLSKVFMEAMDSIVIVDRKGRITNLNAETERAYGWARDELIGQPLFKSSWYRSGRRFAASAWCTASEGMSSGMWKVNGAT